MKKGYVYILISDKDHKSYLGSTDDVVRRSSEHFDGKVTSTKHRRPLRLVYTEELESLLEARAREKYLKTRQGRRELKKIFLELGLK
jgi:putative endonuclease